MFKSLGAKAFSYVHGNHLVYNTCWEDPRLDREALQITANDKIVMITSAGCNALDYVLAGARSVDAVDMNPRQNALLELKLAGIERLDFDRFFEMFGNGRLEGVRQVYQKELRPALGEFSREYWDRNIKFFAGKSQAKSFYFRGSSGLFARLINFYIDHVIHARHLIDSALNAPTLDEQRRIYEEELKPRFWNRAVQRIMNSDMTLALIGVPAAQRRQLEETFGGRIGNFVEKALDEVFSSITLKDNYFYRVYLTGRYSTECCPEYLKRENFNTLKEYARLSIRTHTTSLLEFLNLSQKRFTKFVLLDHMDWLSEMYHELLVEEWQAIVDHSAPGARIIWRSGGVRVDFVDSLPVRCGLRKGNVGNLLRYERERANELHQLDRVRTYGSFYIAEMSPAI